MVLVSELNPTVGPLDELSDNWDNQQWKRRFGKEEINTESFKGWAGYYDWI